MAAAQGTEFWLDTDDGAQLRVLSFGCATAPPLIFVAGWLSLPQGWTSVLDELAGAYRIHYLETREKGSSRLDPRRQRDFSVVRMRRDLALAIDTLVPADQPYWLAGSSLGATVILEHLAAGGRAPRAAALVAPNRAYHFPTWLRLSLPLIPVAIYPLFRYVIKFYLRHFRLDPRREPEQYAKYAATVDCADPRKLKPNARALMDYSLPAAIGDIDTPMLILGGEADRLHGLDDLRWMARQMAQARLLPMASNKATHSAAAGAAIRRFFADGFSALEGQLDLAR